MTQLHSFISKAKIRLSGRRPGFIQNKKHAETNVTPATISDIPWQAFLVTALAASETVTLVTKRSTDSTCIRRHLNQSNASDH